jgi:predicted O-methyltransferase YrrM
MAVSKVFYEIDKIIKERMIQGICNDWEGNISQSKYQVPFLIETIQMLRPNSRILQIGFNAGHSTVAMLMARNDVSVTTVELGKSYTKICSDFIDSTFPGRHKLIMGNSLDVVPTLTDNYDAFFIDGGHEYDVAKKDLENCYMLGPNDSIIIIDDIVHFYDCTKDSAYALGPTKAYKEFLQDNRIIHFAHMEAINRGMSIGIINKN